MWRALAVAAYLALIFFLSSRTSKNLPKIEIPHADKLVHAIEYAGLGLLLCRLLRRSGDSGDESVLTASKTALIIFLGAAYGVSDEYHQTFVPGRNGNDIGDLIADTLGTALGVLLHQRLFRNERWRNWL